MYCNLSLCSQLLPSENCDCSSTTRNGDFGASRWESLKDVVDLVCTRKTESNHENSVGLIKMTYSQSEICLHLTSEKRWLTTLTDVKRSYGRGSIDISEAIHKARLALKHKRNERQTKRIVLVICSPVENPEKELVRAAATLKKNKYSLDIICFGVPENHPSKTVEKLRKMVNKCNNRNADNCAFVDIYDENGGKLRDQVMATPVIYGHGQAAPQPQAQEAPLQAPQLDEFGLELNLRETDPELYQALRLSYELSRQEAENKAAEAAAETEAQPEDVEMEDGANDNNNNNINENNTENNEPAPIVAAENSEPMDEEDEEEDDEEEELRKALQMSLEEEDEESMDENDLEAALALSMQDEEEPEVTPKKKVEDNEEDDDAAFLAELISELPGVETEDLDLDDLLGNDEENGDKK